MLRYETVFDSLNSESYAKPITVLVVEPDAIGPDTGAMLCTHGWGGNRLQHQDKMEVAAAELDLVGVSVEFRQSGYDFDAVRGAGSYRPYDAGFYQVFDVLNGLRQVLRLRPQLNRRRLFHYGGSQGGHIALLSAAYAPRTFAFVYAASPLTHLDEAMQGWAGRAFAPHELAVRDVERQAGGIRCPVFLEHGTADATVPCESHTRRLAACLEALGKTVAAEFHEGGGHGLEPVTTRLQTFRSTVPEPARRLCTDGPDDFAAGSTVRLDCGDRCLVIDWSRQPADMDLFRWE